MGDMKTALTPVEELENWLTKNHIRYWREEFHDGCEIHILTDEGHLAPEEVKTNLKMLSILFDRGGSPYTTHINDYDEGVEDE